MLAGAPHNGSDDESFWDAEVTPRLPFDATSNMPPSHQRHEPQLMLGSIQSQRGAKVDSVRGQAGKNMADGRALGHQQRANELDNKRTTVRNGFKGLQGAPTYFGAKDAPTAHLRSVPGSARPHPQAPGSFLHAHQHQPGPLQGEEPPMRPGSA